MSMDQLNVFASVGIWTERRQRAWPLEKFPPEKQAEIARLVALPKPPPRWLKSELCEMESRAWYEWHWQRGVDPESRREPISPWVRERVYERDGHRCLACGATERLSLDHIVHWSAGGRDTIDNLRTLCVSCNSSRGAKTDVEWRGADL